MLSLSPSLAYACTLQEGELRATARLTLAHLDGAYVDAAVLAADGAVAAISVAPLPPRRHRPALIPGAAAQAAAAAQQQQQQPRFPRVVALVDVAAERTVRELRPGKDGGEGPAAYCAAWFAKRTGPRTQLELLT